MRRPRPQLRLPHSKAILYAEWTHQAMGGGARGGHPCGSERMSPSMTPLLTQVVASVVLTAGLGEDPAFPRLPADAGSLLTH